MDQKLEIGGVIGYGYPYLEFLFHHFKVFRRHAILHDATGEVRTHKGKGPGYGYRIRRGPNSCLFFHVTELLFCVYSKHLLPSTFNSFDFWSSMSWIVLANEFAYINVISKWGFCLMGNIRNTQFDRQKRTNPQTSILVDKKIARHSLR